MEPADLGRIIEGTGVTAVLALQHEECLARFNIDYPEMERGLLVAVTEKRTKEDIDMLAHVLEVVL